MGVYIKGMEMPTSCGECELCACYVLEDGTEENYRCPITMYPIHDFDERHERCPLIPVPPHGRLIDADADPNEYVTVWDCDCSEFGRQTVMAVDDLAYLPTIIPAESEVDNG